MKLVENNKQSRLDYKNLIPNMFNITTAYVAEMDLTGTEKQISYANSLVSEKIAKVMQQAQMQISAGKMTKEFAEEGMKRLITGMEAVKDAGTLISELLKNM